MFSREYNFIANNINQKPSVIKDLNEDLFHLKFKFSASLSRSHYDNGFRKVMPKI